MLYFKEVFRRCDSLVNFNISGLIIILLFIGLIVWLFVKVFRSFSKRNNRLVRIEKKLDDINKQIKKDND